MAPTSVLNTRDSLDVTDFVITKCNGVKGLSEMSLQSVPDQYIQPFDERSSAIKIMSEESIPVIDMSKWNDSEVANAICDASETWGFFQLVNHGIPLEVLEGVKEATHRFFAQPAEEKMKYTKEHSPSNNVRLTTSFVPKAEKALEWKDFLSVLYVSEDEATALWPPACRDQVLEYMKTSDILIKRLLQVLMKRLNVEEIDEALLMGSLRVNLNYYPICPSPELTVGVGRHSDVSTFTILLQDEVGGLYVRGTDGESWIHVPPVAGSLVINVGDALQIMSNGRYKSIEHRVVANASKNRISVPLFVNPKPSAMIGPLPEVLANGEKPNYKQVLYSDYVRHFYQKPHDGKKTLEFAEI